jgi:hypothetical protein
VRLPGGGSAKPATQVTSDVGAESADAAVLCKARTLARSAVVHHGPTTRKTGLRSK